MKDTQVSTTTSTPHQTPMPSFSLWSVFYYRSTAPNLLYVKALKKQSLKSISLVTLKKKHWKRSKQRQHRLDVLLYTKSPYFVCCIVHILHIQFTILTFLLLYSLYWHSWRFSLFSITLQVFNRRKKSKKKI